MRKDQDPTPPHDRRMPDGTPCWCVTEDEPGPGWIHSPRCLMIRTVTGQDRAMTRMGPYRSASQRVKKDHFLAAYRLNGNITRAAAEAGIHRVTVFRWQESDERFSLQMRQAMEASIDLLEEEARRRAYQGTTKPIYQGGKLVGAEQEYSDTLLIFLLKGARPTRYRDNARIEVASDAPAGVPPSVEVLTEAERRRVRDWMDRILEESKPG